MSIISPGGFVDWCESLLKKNDWENDRFVIDLSPRGIGHGQNSHSFKVAQQNCIKNYASFNLVVKIGTYKYDISLGNQEYGAWVDSQTEDNKYFLQDEDMMLVSGKLEEWKNKYQKLEVKNQEFIKLFFTNEAK